MFRQSVLPILREITRPQDQHVRTFRITGTGESIVEREVGGQILALGGVELGYCARPGEVDVRVIGSAEAVAEAERIIMGAFAASVFTTADEELEDVVVRLATQKHATLATAESCTGGALANRLTNVSGASAVFLSGFVTYSNEAKMAALGVDAQLIDEHGAVSEAVAAAMAEGAIAKTGAHFALSTTGIAGPTGGTTGKPVGTVFIALAERDEKVEVVKRRFLADRETFKRLTTQHALEMLRQRLIAH